MSNSLLRCVLLFAFTALLGFGCVDQDAEKIKADRKAYADLLDEVHSFSRYVPAKGIDLEQPMKTLKDGMVRGRQPIPPDELFKRADLRPKWRDHVVAMRGKLEKLIPSLPQSEQGAAYRLLSDMYASTARSNARASEVSGYKIEFQSSRFISLLDLIGISHDRALRYSDNTGVLTSQLSDYKDQTQQTYNQLKSQVDELNQNNTRLKSEITQLRQEADTLQRKSDDLKTDATLEVNLRGKTEKIVKAEESRRIGFQKDAEAQRRERQVEVNTRLLGLLEAHLKIREAELAEINGTSDAAVKRKANQKEQRDASIAALKKAEGELNSSLTNLTGRYKTEVQDKLDVAAQEMKKAYDLAVKANGKARDKNTQADIVLEPVGRRVEYIHILVDHSKAAKGLGLMLANAHAHAKSLGLGEADTFQTHYKALYDKQLELVGMGGTAIAEAVEAAQKNSKGDDVVGDGAKTQLKVLQNYKDRLEASKLPPQPPASIKPVPPLTE